MRAMAITGMPWTRTLQILLLGIWLGAMVFASFAVAPKAFALVGSRDVAARLVGSLLNIIYLGGIAAGLVCLVLEYLYAKTQHRGMLKIVALTLLLALAASLCTRFFLMNQIDLVRQSAVVSLETLAADDPTRLRFDLYHRWSVYLMAVKIVAVGTAMVWALRRGYPR